jgi:chitinase
LPHHTSSFSVYHPITFTLRVTAARPARKDLGTTEVKTMRLASHGLLHAALAALSLGGCKLSDDPAASDAGGSPTDIDAGGDPPAEAPDGGGASASHDVHLRTESSGQYLSAKNAGGDDLTAAGTLPREWELFHLVDENGSDVVDGDTIYLRAFDGVSYLRVEAGVVDARGTTMGAAEAFVIVRNDGPGAIHAGDHVALRSALTSTFVSAEGGGGSTVTATATTSSAWEHFVVDGLPPDDTMPPTGGARVIGYLPNWYGSYADWATRVDFSRLTQVNLAFALGDDDGDLELAPGDQIDTFVAAAHAAGVKVFPSLCGGGGDGRIAPHYEPGNVDAFVDKILAFVERHDLDGIDIDVEAPQRMGAKYDTFIAKLKAKAAPRGLPVTAAVAPWMQDGMANETLRSFDFITVMSYDNAGTWTGAGAHSSYQQAVDAISFYSERGVDPERIVLGVPFYGYCWGNCNGPNAAYVLYKDIVARFPDAWDKDWIQEGGATYSFNGVPTMKAKTELGKQYGGIMIWELGGDLVTTNPRSLLVAVDDAL